MKMMLVQQNNVHRVTIAQMTRKMLRGRKSAKASAKNDRAVLHAITQTSTRAMDVF